MTTDFYNLLHGYATKICSEFRRVEPDELISVFWIKIGHKFVFKDGGVLYKGKKINIIILYKYLLKEAERLSTKKLNCGLWCVGNKSKEDREQKTISHDVLDWSTQSPGNPLRDLIAEDSIANFYGGVLERHPQLKMAVSRIRRVMEGESVPNIAKEDGVTTQAVYLSLGQLRKLPAERFRCLRTG